MDAKTEKLLKVLYHANQLKRTARTGWVQRGVLDPENVAAHYNLDLIFKQLGDRERAAKHFELYQKYRPDDNARDRAIALHRAGNPAADHAADAIVIYDLNRQEDA